MPTSITAKPTVTSDHHKRYADIMKTPVKNTTSNSKNTQPVTQEQKTSRVKTLLAGISNAKGIGNKIFVFTGKKKIILDGKDQEIEKIKTVDPIIEIPDVVVISSSMPITIPKPTLSEHDKKIIAKNHPKEKEPEIIKVPEIKAYAPKYEEITITTPDQISLENKHTEAVPPPIPTTVKKTDITEIAKHEEHKTPFAKPAQEVKPLDTSKPIAMSKSIGTPAKTPVATTHKKIGVKKSKTLLYVASGIGFIIFLICWTIFWAVFFGLMKI